MHKIVIRGKLDGLNDYIRALDKSRYTGAKVKKENQQVCEIYIRNQMRGIRIKKPVRMVYKWYEPNKNRDLDNVSSFGRKVIQDALVTMRVLENDGWRSIAGFSDEFYVDKKNPRIEVYIEEAG